MKKYEPLTREEVISVIDGKSFARRVPINIHFWVHADTFGEREGEVREILAEYPQDIQIQSLKLPDIFISPPDDSNYRWVNWDNANEGVKTGLDERIAIQDWDLLDEIIEHFPNPEYPGLFADFNEPRDTRYRLGHWWFCLFERHWSLRGMTNALTDYYLEPDKVHRLFRAITDFYLRIIERAANEQKCDGMWFSDDLGTQTGPFFSLEFFRSFFLPYYREIFSKCHDLGMHTWMHSCGNIDTFLPDWIDAGLDIIHPIQKHTMNENEIASKYKGEITFFTGLDVQQIIPWGTPSEVCSEVRYLLDTYWNDGHCILTAGNGINQDCSLDSLKAFLEEAVTYGKLRVY